MMQEFAEKSAQVRESVDQIKEMVSDVGVAVEESAKGIVNVKETSVDLTTGVAGVENEAHSNMDVANELYEEVNKFKLH